MTKEELKQVYNTNKEIKMWQKELDRLQCKSLVKGQEITDMPFGVGTSDKVADLATEIADTKAVINGLLARIQIERRKTIEYIESIDSSKTRQIVFLYCVSNMNFYQISKEMGPGYTYDCVRQNYYRWLKKENIT